MGRHVMGLSPGVKPRYRFVVALVGIVAMAAATLVIAAAIAPVVGEADVVTTPSTPTTTLVDPTIGPSPTGPVNAVYAIPPGGVNETGFHAQVTLNNPTAEPLSWEVRLVFDDGVTELTQSWIDGQPAEAAIAGPEFTFAGATDLGPGLTAVLRLEFATTPNADIDLRLCTANGRPCSRV